MLAGLVVVGTGLLVALLGLAIIGGRTELLAQYSTRDGPAVVRYGAGGTLAFYGLATVGLGVVIANGGGSEGLWLVWTGLTVIVSFGVAALGAASQN